MPFEPGKSGNPDGRRREKIWRATLDRVCKQENGERVRKAVEQLLDQAAGGESWAIKELAERLDGKATQIIGGDEENPLYFAEVVRKIVAPGNPDA